MDVHFADVPKTERVNPTPKQRLRSVGLIYYRAWQAFQLPLTRNLDMNYRLPLAINAFSNGPGVYWAGPYSLGSNPGLDPYINITTAHSLFSDPNTPTTVSGMRSVTT